MNISTTFNDANSVEVFWKKFYVPIINFYINNDSFVFLSELKIIYTDRKVQFASKCCKMEN